MYAAPSPDGAARGERGQASPDQIARAFDAASVGLAVLDRDLRFVRVNEQLARLNGRPAADHVGLTLDELGLEPSPGVVPALESVLGRGEPVLAQRLLRDDPGRGRVDHLLVDYVPLPGEEGRPAGVVVAVVDTTALADAGLELAAVGATHRDGTDALARLWAIEHVADVTLARLPIDTLLHELLARLRQAMRADTATVLLLDEERGVLVVRASSGLDSEVRDRVEVPVGAGFAGRIAAIRATVAVPDVRYAEVVNPAILAHVRSLLGAPLVVEGRVLGVIHVGSRDPRTFDDDDRRLIELAAERAAAAIHVAETRERLTAAARHVGLLHELDRLILDERPAAEVAAAAAVALRAETGCLRVAIAELDPFSGGFSVLAQDGAGSDRLPPGAPIAVRPVDVEALAAGRVVTIDLATAQGMDAAVSALREAGVAVVRLLPLLLETRLLGLLALCHAAGAPVSADQLAAAAGVGGQVAIAIRQGRLRDQEALAQQIVASAPMGIAVYGQDRRYRLMNPFLAELRGVRPADVVGRAPEEMIPALAAIRADELIRRACAGETVELADEEFPGAASDGGSRWLQSTLAPLRDARGEIVGALGLGREITLRKRDQLALQRLADRLALIGDLQRRMLAARSVEELAMPAVATLRRLTGAVRGSIVVPSGSDWVVAAVEGAVDPLDPGAGFATEGYRDSFVRELDGISRTDVDDLADRDLVTRLGRAGIGLVLTAPLVSDGELVGGLNLSFAPDAELGGEVDELMREVGPGLAVGLARLRAREALERQAHVLEERVAERTRELEDVNVELERFAYTVSHDLRAPLRAMEGLSDALLEDVGEALGPDGTEYARRIRSAAQRMDVLIHDLLAYSRVTTSKLEIESVDLDVVVADALGLVAGPIAAADAEVGVERALGIVLGQRAMVAQAVANLVGNAVKFSRDGVRPVVGIRSEPRGAALRLWVEDNGIGVEPRHAERIFGVFERLHGTEAYPGTGIGLAIVAKAAERLGGRSGVEPATPCGSRFWLELPRAEAGA